MGFVPDRRFDSLTEAFQFLATQYSLRLSEHYLVENASGLIIPEEVPRYLFRGECGDFERTIAAIQRHETYRKRDGRQLSTSDLDRLQLLLRSLAYRFAREPDYSLQEHEAIGLLQHYGLPTQFLDFTGHLGHAFTFASAGVVKTARIAVVPFRELFRTGSVINLSSHPWAERPQRQAAFAVLTTGELNDLKSAAARSILNVSWYEFPVCDSDQVFFKDKYEALIRTVDDPSAGFLRFHITEYVEAHGKFSPELTDWLIERIPIAPRCYRIKAFDGNEVVVNHRGANALRHFDEFAEAQHSKRYWSSSHCDSSWDRMKGWTWPPEGSVVADPRTYHPSL